jgi:hypothetical protein
LRLLVAGSREGFCYDDVHNVLDELPDYITEVVSGTARGVDSFGERWAYNRAIPVKKFPANWELYGKRAGFLRNEEMAKYADKLIAFWDGSSKGTLHMIQTMGRLGKPVKVYDRK